MIATKDMYDRHDDMTISNTGVTLDPCLVGFEEESGENGSGKHTYDRHTSC